MLVLFLKGYVSICFKRSAYCNAGYRCDDVSLFFFFFDNGMGISVKSVYMLNYIYLLMYLVLWCPYLVLV